jgi:hypothetical protein
MLALEKGAASMGGAVRIIRLDLTAKELRAAAGREKDGSAALTLPGNELKIRLSSFDGKLNQVCVEIGQFRAPNRRRRQRFAVG